MKKISTSCLLFWLLTWQAAFAQPLPNYALSFNGGNWVEIPDHTSLSPCPTCPFTVELWVFRESVNPLQHLLGKRSGCDDPSDYYQMVFDPNLGFGNSLLGSAYTNIYLPQFEWHYLAAVFDGAQFLFYYDGVFMAAGSGTIDDGTGNSLILAGSGDCYGQYFGGKIDNVRIWNVARTQEEIQADMFECINGSEPGLAGAWDFDEGGSNIAHDHSPNHNDGKLINNPEWVISSLPWCEAKDKRGMATAYNNIGDVYLGMKNYAKALKNYQAALKLWEETGDADRIALTYRMIGIVNCNLYDHPEALKNLITALKFGEKAGNPYEIAYACAELGKVHAQLNQYAEAKYYFLRSLSISKEKGAKEIIKSVYDGLSKLENVMGNYREAMEYYKQYIVYKDSLWNENMNVQILHFKEQYESEKKDREILELTSEKGKLENENKSVT